MTKTEEWAFDGQLDVTETPTTSPAEERAKIAALFGKSAPEQKASEPIDYAVAFATHKGKQAPEPKDQEQVKLEQETPSQTDSEGGYYSLLQDPPYPAIEWPSVRVGKLPRATGAGSATGVSKGNNRQNHQGYSYGH